MGALFGGAGARGRLDEKVAQESRRTHESGEPPFEVDLDSGVVRLRRPEPDQQ